MKKKIFFIIPSLAAGGSEKVFWTLSRFFNKEKYEVVLVLLDSNHPFFSMEIEDVRVVELKTVRASKSFFKLLKLLRKEKPYAVYTTSGQVNLLIAIVSLFVNIPKLIGRIPNIPHEMSVYAAKKSKFSFLSKFGYRQFDVVVSQSDEMKTALRRFKIQEKRIRVIPNPIIPVDIINKSRHESIKKLIIVGRLAKEKGHDRLLAVMAKLPKEYQLSIAGDGILRTEIEEQIKELGLGGRVNLMGQVKDVLPIIAQHHLLVLPSYTEGFPNVIIEALSVGTPVVTFKVGGTSSMIIDGFNGYNIEQGNVKLFKQAIIDAGNKSWNHKEIKHDAVLRFGVEKIIKEYAALIE